MSAGGRNVASVAFGPIDEISPKAEVYADANYSFGGFSNWAETGDDTAQPPANASGNFDTPSATFVYLVSQRQRDGDLNMPGGLTDGAGLQNILDTAIRAYEGSANVVANTAQKRGTSFSVVL